MKSKLWWKGLAIAALVLGQSAIAAEGAGRRGVFGWFGRNRDSEGDPATFVLELDREGLRARLEDENPDAPKSDIDALFKQVVASANETTVGIVRERLRSAGIRKARVERTTNDLVAVVLPRATPEQLETAERVITPAAFLEFYLVATDNDEKCADLFAKRLFSKIKAPRGYRADPEGRYYVRDEKVPPPDPRELRRFGDPGPTKIFLLEKDRIEGTDQTVYRPLFVERKAKMTGMHLAKADTATDDMGRTVVTLAFDSVGTKQLAQVTGKYAATDTRAGRHLAIVLDGVSFSHPCLKEPITGGRAVISGSFTSAEATMLKNVLNAGALPAPLRIVEKSSPVEANARTPAASPAR